MVVVAALRAANVKVESKVVVFVLLAAVESKVVVFVLLARWSPRATVGKLAAVVILERVLVQVLLLLLLVLL